MLHPQGCPWTEGHGEGAAVTQAFSIGVISPFKGAEIGCEHCKKNVLCYVQSTGIHRPHTTNFIGDQLGTQNAFQSSRVGEQ